MVIAILARAYLTGNGVERDVPEGLRLARLSSVLGSPSGNTLLGLIRMRGDFGVERSEEEAFAHFLRGAGINWRCTTWDLRTKWGEALVLTAVKPGCGLRNRLNLEIA